MNLFLDSCVPSVVRDELRSLGHDVIWSGDWPQDPGDNEILEHARLARRILITLDKDFGELAVVRGARLTGILRIADFSVSMQVRAIQEALDRHGSELVAGAVVTVRPGRIRIRPAESDLEANNGASQP